MPARIAGIDIGESAVDIAVITDDGAETASVQLPENTVSEGRIIAPDVLAQCIGEVRRQCKTPVKQCFLGLAENQTYTRRVTLPMMTIEQLELNLPYEFRDYITEDSENYVYDYIVLEIINNEAGEPESMELLASAASKALIDELGEIMRNAGMKLVGAIPRELVFSRMLEAFIEATPEGEGPHEYCMVNLGYNDVFVDTYNHAIYQASRTIEMGCSDIDRAIADLKGVDQHVARTYRLSNYENVLEDPACQTVYASIAVEIMKVLNFYRFSNPDTQLQDVYFCGLGAHNTALMDAITDTIDMNTHSITELFPPALRDVENLAQHAPAAAMALRAEQVGI